MRYLILLLLLIGAVSCAKAPESAGYSYWMNEGTTAMQSKDYEDAAQAFDYALTEADSPEEAKNAQYHLAKAYFADKNYDDAIPALSTFVELYPEAPEIAEMRFDLGTSYYEKRNSIDRDQTNTQLALNIFQDTVSVTKDPKMSDELQKKIVELRDMLAQHEIYVAELYLRVKRPSSAEGRFIYAIKNYPDTKSIPSAYFQLVKLLASTTGKSDLATQYLNEFREKHPKSPYHAVLSAFNIDDTIKRTAAKSAAADNSTRGK